MNYEPEDPYAMHGAIKFLTKCLDLESLGKVFKFVEKNAGTPVVNLKDFGDGLCQLDMLDLVKLVKEIASQVEKKSKE